MVLILSYLCYQNIRLYKQNVYMNIKINKNYFAHYLARFIKNIFYMEKKMLYVKKIQ